MSYCRVWVGVTVRGTSHLRSQSLPRSHIVGILNIHFNSTARLHPRAFSTLSRNKQLHTSSSGRQRRHLPPCTPMAASVAALTTDSAMRQRTAAGSTASTSSSASSVPSPANNVKATRSHSTHSTSSTSNHGHSHSHSPFGSHSHTHSHSGDSEEAAALAAAFSGSNDRGSRIILWGLASNVALTAAKGVGGVMLHSASLLADAGHSLSDLLGDIVVLFSWRLSRRPASRAFQYGYGNIRISIQCLCCDADDFV